MRTLPGVLSERGVYFFLNVSLKFFWLTKEEDKNWNENQQESIGAANLRIIRVDLLKLNVTGVKQFELVHAKHRLSYAAVFGLAPPLSPQTFVGREWGNDTKNGCVGGYAKHSADVFS